MSHYAKERTDDHYGPHVVLWCPERDEELIITKTEYVDFCPMCGQIVETEQ